MAKRCVVIAVDGPSASGKGTICKLLAEKLGYAYLDTGLLYRAVAASAVEHGTDIRNVPAVVALVENIDFAHLDPKKLGTEEIGGITSQIASIPELRQALHKAQHSFITGKQGAVIDGRDIGSVIFPDAECKFYITATPEVRAMRRFKQLQDLEKYATYDGVLQDIKARDLRDMTRSVSPLIVAPGAIVVDTSEMDINYAVSFVLQSIAYALRLY